MQTRQEASKQKNSNCIFLQRTTSNDPVGFNYVCRLDDWFDSNKKKPMIAKWKNRKIPKWLNDFEYAFEKKVLFFEKKTQKRIAKYKMGSFSIPFEIVSRTHKKGNDLHIYLYCIQRIRGWLSKNWRHCEI